MTGEDAASGRARMEMPGVEPASPGAWLQAMRNGLGLTQEELGNRIGYSREMVRKIEADERQLSRDALERLGDLLGLPSEERTALTRLARGEAAAGRLQAPSRLAQLRASAGLPNPNPYRGLFAFREQDAPFFRGREQLTRSLAADVLAKGLVAVVGPSGSGKSSVVLAGLVPFLRQGGAWAFAQFRPGEVPFQAMASALLPLLEPDLPEASLFLEAQHLAGALRQGTTSLTEVAARVLQKRPAGTRVLLLVDQFEEMYTQCSDTLERAAFIDVLVSGSPQSGDPRAGLRTVLTLRADFLGHCLTDRGLSGRLQEGCRMAGPMTEEELRSAIEIPAAQLGVRFEEGLPERIARAVRGHDSALPLLEFTLTLLWEHREGERLTHRMYDRIGGVERALVNHADGVIEAMPAAQQERARQLLVRLVHPGQDGPDTRRTVTRAELGEERWGTAQTLAAARLVVIGQDEPSGEETAEIVHEALVTEWSRLGEWIESSRAFRLWQDRTHAQAEQWGRSKDDDAPLLRGSVLATALEWRSSHGEQFSPLERSFVQASEARARQDRASRRGARRRFIAALAAVSVTIVALAAVAVSAWSGFREKEGESLARYLAGQSRALVEGSQDTAVLLALEAFRIADIPESRGALLDGLLYARRLMTYVQSHPDQAFGVAISKDSRLVAVGNRDHNIYLWDISASPPRLTVLSGHSSWVIDVAFSPRDSILVSSSADGTLRLWDTGTGRPIGAPLRGHSREILAVAFSPDGRLIASGSVDRSVRLWEASNGRPLGSPLRGHTDEVSAVAFSPDGRFLASAGFDHTVRLWNTTNGQPLGAPLQAHDGEVWGLTFSPDGETLASAGFDGYARFWRWSGGNPRLEREWQSQAAVFRIAYTADGRRLAMSGSDGLLRILDVTQGELAIPAVPGHRGYITGVAHSQGGILATSGFDGALRLWNPYSGEQLLPPLVSPEEHEGGFLDVAYSAAGQLASAGADGSVRLWDADTGVQLSVLRPRLGPVNSVSFNPDGSLVAFGGEGGILVWETAGSRPPETLLDAGGDPIVRVAVGEGWLVAGSKAGLVRLWSRAREWQQTGVLHDPSGGLADLAVSPEGRWIAAAGVDRAVRLWDRPAQALKDPPMLHDAQVARVAFSPDGTILATSTSDALVHLWSTRTGRPATAPLLGHRTTVQSLAFGPAGNILASGADRSIRLWDPVSGEVLGQGISSADDLDSHAGRVTGIAFSRDSRTLVSAGVDRTIRRWNLDMGSWPKLACEFAGRNLTQEEWRRHMGSRPYLPSCRESP